MGSVEKNVALVFGASGISGWAVTKNLMSYPTTTTFARVIGLSNKPVDLPNSRLPIGDRRLEMYHGINLRGDLPSVVQQMKATVPHVEEVTHVYYCVYSNASAYAQDVMELLDINVGMTGNAVHAIDQVCTNLQFLVLQTGTNNYGVAVYEFQDKIKIDPPLRETLPRIPSPWGDEIFYYGQVDLIKKAQKGKTWKWCEVRPDTIIGFTPGMTNMTSLEPIGLFLSLWRYVNGQGASIPYIGTAENYRHTNSDSSQDIIARSHIYLSVVKPEAANGEAFNVADSETPTSWVGRWPILASYFGLKGLPPDGTAEDFFPAEKWWNDHQEEYKQMCTEFGLRERTIPPESWIFVRAACLYLKRDRHLSLEKIRDLGFREEFVQGQGHIIGFDRMVESKILPPSEAMKMGASNC